jgi:hypothetical protein
MTFLLFAFAYFAIGLIFVFAVETFDGSLGEGGAVTAAFLWPIFFPIVAIFMVQEIAADLRKKRMNKTK